MPVAGVDEVRSDCRNVEVRWIFSDWEILATTSEPGIVDTVMSTFDITTCGDQIRTPELRHVAVAKLY